MKQCRRLFVVVVCLEIDNVASAATHGCIATSNDLSSLIVRSEVDVNFEVLDVLVMLLVVVINEARHLVNSSDADPSGHWMSSYALKVVVQSRWVVESFVYYARCFIVV